MSIYTLEELKHPQEKERVKALEDLRIMDTPPEERFDRFTRLAVDIFKVPTAYISLLDEKRQWMKSRNGEIACEVNKEISFCAHTILQTDPLIIADSLLDARFADNPFVLGKPHIRFYAGHPLLSFDQLPVGALCIIDTQPRQLQRNELRIFKELAKMVQQELHHMDKFDIYEELRKRQESCLVSQERLAEQLTENCRAVRAMLAAPQAA